MSESDPAVPDDPVRASLEGPHARLAQRRGEVLRYEPDVAPFVSVPDDDWDDVAALVGAGEVAVVTGPPPTPPPGWEVVMDLPGTRMVDAGIAAAPDPEAVRLRPDDVAEMMALVERTRPGPFLPRAIEMGTYLGLRHGGELVAMAGERLHPPGATEISAVCTHPDHRGRGHATRLVHAVAAGIRARGETPFLHTAADNHPAIRLYEHLGFVLIARPTFTALRVPPTRTQVPDDVAHDHLMGADR